MNPTPAPRRLHSTSIAASFTASCIMANVVMELGRPIVYDPKSRKVFDDRDATKHLRREYRKPWKHPAA